MNTRCRRSRCLATAAFCGCLTVVAIAGAVPATLTGMIDPFGYMRSFEASLPVFASVLTELGTEALAISTPLVFLTAFVLLLSYGIEFTANYRAVLATANAIETQGKGCHRAHWKLRPAMESSVGAVGIAGISPFYRPNGLTNLPISTSEGGSCV